MPSEFETVITRRSEYGTVITQRGAALLADCILRGKKLPVTQAAAGDGGGGPVMPEPDWTALVNERWRGEIAGAELSAAAPNMIDVKIVMGDEVGGFVIREMGLFSDGGELIAVCNTPDTEKVSISSGVSGRLTMVMHIVVADASALEFAIAPSLDMVSRQELEEALAEHGVDPEAHPDIRAAVAAHDGDPGAHGDLRGQTASLEARLSLLELMYGTDVSGNPFTVTMDSLAGVKAEGVWNTAQGRLEF